MPYKYFIAMVMLACVVGGLGIGVVVTMSSDDNNDDDRTSETVSPTLEPTLFLTQVPTSSTFSPSASPTPESDVYSKF